MSKLRTLVAVGLIGFALAGLARLIQGQEGTSGGLRSLNEERRDYRAGDDGLVREVRLALVCYGGSSLAIYIHGNTKEIHRLVQASKALQQDAMAEVSNAGGRRASFLGGTASTSSSPPPTASDIRRTWWPAIRPRQSRSAMRT
jgi:hypothetical protein